MSKISVRLVSDYGRNKLDQTSDSKLHEIKTKAAEVLSCKNQDITLSINGVQIKEGDNMPLSKCRTIKHGVTINVVSKKSNNEMMMEEKKAPQKLGQSFANTNNVKKDEPRSKCTHGPNGMCVHCLGKDDDKFAKDKKDNKKMDEEALKRPEMGGGEVRAPIEEIIKKCSHPPYGMCTHCIDRDTVKGKHKPFDRWLGEVRQNCQHPADTKCNNCSLNFEVSYKKKPYCSKHNDKGSCIQCLPPALHCKRQEYRHVDYVSFLNMNEVQEFEQNWKQYGEQRVGFLYGYFCEDPDYEDGIRVMVETIYEPPQQGTYDKFKLLDDPRKDLVNQVAEAMGLEMVGWIYTSRDKENYISPKESVMIAKLQNEHLHKHACGYMVPKFVTVILHEYNPEDPTSSETYMIADQFGAIVRDGVAKENQSTNSKIMFKDNKEFTDMPNVQEEGKTVTEVDSAFFIVSINHGVPKHSLKEYAYVKNYDFPVANRTNKQKNADLKKYLGKWKNKGKDCYANLHFLLYLAQEMDVQDLLKLAAYSTDPNYKEDETILNLICIVDMIQNYH